MLITELVFLGARPATFFLADRGALQSAPNVSSQLFPNLSGQQRRPDLSFAELGDEAVSQDSIGIGAEISAHIGPDCHGWRLGPTRRIGFILFDGPGRFGHLSRRFSTTLKGVTHENPDGVPRQEIIGRCSIGEELRLVPEPDSPFDAQAVKVCRQNGEQIGYLPKRKLGHATDDQRHKISRHHR